MATQHNFTIQGKATTAEYIPTVTEEEINQARANGDDSTLHFGKIIHEQDDISNFVQTCVNFQPNIYTGNIPPNWTEKIIFSNGDIKNLPSKSKGIKASEVVLFWNMITPYTKGETDSKNIINLMLNDKFGSVTDNYTVHCFDAATLQPFQPILFTVEQTITTETGGDIEITVTDSSGGLEYRIEGGDWQSSNIFTDLPSGVIVVNVRDSTGIFNNRIFNVIASI